MKRFLNKSVCFILCLAMLFSTAMRLVPIMSSEDPKTDAYITYNGSKINAIKIIQDEKKTLSAVTLGMQGQEYQWQILVNKDGLDIWVNILDKVEQTCEVSYALVNSMLDDVDSASIRCKVTYNGGVVYTAPVAVSIEFRETDPSNSTSFDKPEYVEVTTDAEQLVEVPAEKRNANPNARETELITVTINYLEFSSINGEKVTIYSSYVATIEKGSAFKQNVVSPTFLGYAPVFDADNDGDYDDDASTIVLNYAKLDKSVEINVYYKPIEVKFAVRYFFQNIHDDMYTEDVSKYYVGSAETGTIISDEFLIQQAGDTTGFAKMYHIPTSVAADGSTVFECYYDRNYYLVMLDCDGGYGADPVYAKFDTPFIVNTPVKPGYTFQGWDLIDEATGKGNNAADEIISVVPSYNMSYIALWKAVNTTYKVAYWLDNKDGTYVEDANGQYYYDEDQKLYKFIRDENVTGKTKYRYENGTYTYIGTNIVSSESNKYVAGKDDLYSSTTYICGKQAGVDGHTHGTDCKIQETRYNYLFADENVLVEGDGSTVVNVYYEAKVYTLRFIYARYTATNGYQVVGGSSYPFGNYKDSNGKLPDASTTLESLLSRVSQWGKVKKPEFNEWSDEKKARYITGTFTDTSKTTTYYYVQFSAYYGSYIGDVWPVDIFQPVQINEKHSSEGHSASGKNCAISNYAYFSAWNGEYKVKYTQDATKTGGSGNQTIKGRYLYLDENLLYASKDNNGKSIADSSLVNYLCFWENGADVSWSEPHKFYYDIYLQDPVTKEYVLNTVLSCVVYDDADRDTEDGPMKGQTRIYIPGYQVQESKAEDCIDYGDPVLDEKYNIYIERYRCNFYYDVLSYTLSLDDLDIQIPDKDLYYGSNLSEYLGTPTYPTVLEPNAYYFEGWYTTADCLPESKIDPATFTMPASDLRLYANWIPKTHDVNFFIDYEDMLVYEAGDTTVTLHASYADILHGNVVGTVSNPVKIDEHNAGLTFAGWFYMDNGEKKPYLPQSIPVKKDLNVFAEWSSLSPQPYRVSYMLEGTTTKVADDTFGYAFAGSTRTFISKAGSPYNQLYAQYNNGYFPTVASHSLTMQIEEDYYNPSINVHTFYYVQAANIEYTIRYVDLETGMVLGVETKTSQAAVVTEKYKVFEGYVPDAFYKRLVLSVEKDENNNYVGTDDNVITFYYTPNVTQAYYVVHYMTEKLNATDNQRDQYFIDGTGGYEEVEQSTEGIGVIGKKVTVTPKEIAGFTLKEIAGKGDNTIAKVTPEDKATVFYTGENYSIKVVAEGTELYIFYTRNTYSYSVKYYVYNTEETVAATKTGTAKYGETITEAPLSGNKIREGFTCVTGTATKEMLIREDETNNEIIFYYSPIQYTVEYVAITPDMGWLSKTIEVISGDTLFEGSLPTAFQSFQFVGWYLDEECTIPVGSEATVDSSGKLTPIKGNLSLTERNIYYAKFERKDAGSLTIQRKGAEEDQVFVYEVKDNITNETITVTIVGNGSVTITGLKQGSYTITQQNDWSWRYDDAPRTISHTAQVGSTTVVEFAPGQGSSISGKWVSGNSDVVVNGGEN